jgi:ankyrin repeat protein
MDANPIIKAVQGGEVEDVEALLSSDERLAETRNENGVSLVLLALYHRQPGMAQLVAQALVTNRGLDVFECAALGRSETLVALLEDDPGLVAARSPDGFTALHLACFFAQTECVRALLRRGAQTNVAASNPTAVHPLHSAVAAHQQKIVQSLLDAGADPNARQQGDFTALHAAAHSGQASLVDLLLSHGADPCLEDKDGVTAAGHARQAGHAALADQLDGRPEPSPSPDGPR